MKKIPEYFDWVHEQAMEILKKMDYNVDGEQSVHQQFLERHQEQLKNLIGEKPKVGRPKGRKNLTSSKKNPNFKKKRYE